MMDFEQLIERAVAEQDIPGCVLHATNRDGSFQYVKSFGTRSVRPGADQSPLTPSTIMWIASCTKLMTSICCLQLVERGLLTLDEPVYAYIPELKNFPVITGFTETGEPIEEPHKNPITLRTLLTHTSGLSYDTIHPKLTAWLKYHGKEDAGPAAGTILERFNRPLVFEPGEGWMYGPSIDFAGLLIERVTKMSIEEYMKKNLWEPLGIKDMTFHLHARPDLRERMAEMSFRSPETGKVGENKEWLSYLTTSGAEVTDRMGGQGVFTSPEEYIKVLHALLVTDKVEDEKILRKKTVDLCFSKQLGKESKGMLNAVLQDEMANNAMGGTSRDLEKDWGLGGVMIDSDAQDGKREGTMFWGGLPNLIWWVDRKTGLVGLYAGQVLPTGDAKCAALNRKFEAGVYEMYGKHEKSRSGSL